MNNLYKFHCDRAEYMLLSYRKLATASSSLPGHDPCCAVDRNANNSWVPKEGKPGEWLCVDLGSVKSVHAVKLCCNFSVSLYGSTNGKDYVLLGEKLGGLSTGRTVYFEKELRLRFLKLVLIAHAVKRFSVTHFEVLGFGNSNPPKKVEKAFAVMVSDAEAIISWSKVITAIGYRIRFGMIRLTRSGRMQAWQPSRETTSSIFWRMACGIITGWMWIDIACCRAIS